MSRKNGYGLITIKGRRFFVFKQNGKIINRRKQKGSGFRTIKDISRIHKENGTFFKNRYITRLTNVKEKSFLRSDKKTYSYSKKKSSQYVIIGTVNNNVISARSDKKLWQSRKAAREQAYTRFLNLLHENITGKYDVDVDKQTKESYLEDVKNIKEGWVYYEKV